MAIEIAKSLDEVLDGFEGRRIDSEDNQEEREDLDIQDKAGFQNKLNSASKRVFSEYDSVKGDDSRGISVQYRKGPWNYVPLIYEQIDSNVSLLVSKVFVGDQSFVQFNLVKGSPGDVDPITVYRGSDILTPEVIGVTRVWKQGSSHVVTHREINPRYRRQGIGTAFFGSSESFVQKDAVNEQNDQEILYEASQLDLIYFLNNNGYKPKTEEDEKKLLMVLNADESLCIGEDYFIFSVEVSPEDRIHYNFHNAFKINFVKKVECGEDLFVRDIQDNVVEKFGRV